MKKEITVGINKHLRAKLANELKYSPRAVDNMLHADMSKAARRRHVEDKLLAKELGCTITELTE